MSEDKNRDEAFDAWVMLPDYESSASLDDIWNAAWEARSKDLAEVAPVILASLKSYRMSRESTAPLDKSKQRKSKEALQLAGECEG